MSNAVIYSKPSCPYCIRAKSGYHYTLNLLNRYLDISDFEEVCRGDSLPTPKKIPDPFWCCRLGLVLSAGSGAVFSCIELHQDKKIPLHDFQSCRG